MSHRRARTAVHAKANASPGGGGNRQAEDQPARPSVAIFVVLALALLVLYTYPYQATSLPRRCLDAYLAGYAHAVAAVLWIFDRSVRAEGNLISGHFSLLIVRNCDAASVLVLFLAALVAYPANYLQRLAGAVLGLALLSFFNVARIASVYFIGITWPGAVEIVHWQVWPIILLVMAALSFLAWVSWTRRPARLT
jgi:exosortase/archaeosortase family protein